MNRLSAKLGLFACVWYELAAEGGLSPGGAFIVTLLLTFAVGFAAQMLGLAMQIVGAPIVAIAFQGFVWLCLFRWLAPPIVSDLPLFAIMVGLVLLGLAGARCRQSLDNPKTRVVWERQGRSLVIVLLLIVGAAFSVFALPTSGSIWLLAGYALLPLIPFRIGWQFAPPASPEHADARMGNAKSFEEAGWSAER